MALVNCKDCGAQLSRSANRCMQCGWRGLSGNSMGALRILGGFILLVFILPMGLSFCFSSSSPSTALLPSPTPFVSGTPDVGGAAKRKAFVKIFEESIRARGAQGTVNVGGLDNEVLVVHVMLNTPVTAQDLDYMASALMADGNLRALGFRKVSFYAGDVFQSYIP